MPLEVREQAGVERGYAIELTGDTCRRFYRHGGRITKTLASLISRDPTRRVRLIVNAFLTYRSGAREGLLGRWFAIVAVSVAAIGALLDLPACPFWSAAVFAPSVWITTA